MKCHLSVLRLSWKAGETVSQRLNVTPKSAASGKSEEKLEDQRSGIYVKGQRGEMIMEVNL